MPEVGPPSRRSDVATPIRPVTGRHWLSPAFRCPASRQSSLRSAFLRGGGMLGFTMFRSSSDERFSPCLLHRQSWGPCACMFEDKRPDCVPFWLEPVSVFGSLHF